MNPIDDYAALRPDVEPPTPAALDQLWDRALAPEAVSAGGRSSAEGATGGRRRVAVLGAAASLIVGIGAIALVAGRAEAPTGVADTPSEAATAETIASTTVDEPAPAAPVGVPPTWAITESGWVSSAPVTSFDPGVANVTLVAGPDGVSESWVAIVDGVSDPMMSVGGLADSTTAVDESGDPIIAWRTDPAIGNYIVSAGGVSQADAQGVFTAVEAGAELPPGFTVLPDASGSLAQRRVTQRFDHPDGRWIEIDTQSGGQPRYDAEMQQATAAEFFDTPEGVDVSNIAYPGEYTLLLRTGFWVSTVRTSASPEAATDFAAMIEFVELGPDADAVPDTTVPETTVPGTTVPDVEIPAPIKQIAIGDSVLLGAAQELAELGLTVDAVESRAFVNGLDFVRSLAEQDRLPETMVVHLGGNGPILPTHMAELVGLVDDVDTVLLLTSAIDRDYAAGNNELIYEAAAANDNIELLDWAGFATSCSGDCFEADGFHLKPDGRAYYAMLIEGVLDASGT